VHGGSIGPDPTSQYATGHYVTLDYSYFAGEYRSGKYTRGFATDDEANDFIRKLKDKRVTIRYKESNPDVSCLETSEIERALSLSSDSG